MRFNVRSNNRWGHPFEAMFRVCWEKKGRPWRDLLTIQHDRLLQQTMMWNGKGENRIQSLGTPFACNYNTIIWVRDLWWEKTMTPDHSRSYLVFITGLSWVYPSTIHTDLKYLLIICAKLCSKVYIPLRKTSPQDNVIEFAKINQFKCVHWILICVLLPGGSCLFWAVKLLLFFRNFFQALHILWFSSIFCISVRFPKIQSYFKRKKYSLMKATQRTKRKGCKLLNRMMICKCFLFFPFILPFILWDTKICRSENWDFNKIKLKFPLHSSSS